MTTYPRTLLVSPHPAAAHVPAFKPAPGVTSARLEMMRAAEWISRVCVRTERGWLSPVPFRLHLRDGVFSCWTTGV